MLLVAASVSMAATGAAFATMTASATAGHRVAGRSTRPPVMPASFSRWRDGASTQTIAPRRRTAPFARTARSDRWPVPPASCGGHPGYATAWYGFDRVTVIRAMFVAYGVVGHLVADLVPTSVERGGGGGWGDRKHPWDDRAVGLRAAALVRYGFVGHRLSCAVAARALAVSGLPGLGDDTATILFWSGVRSAVSYLIAVRSPSELA